MSSQHKFESDIYRTLCYGDETYLAEKNGVGASYYSQMLNPEDPRKSHFFRAATDLYLLIQKDSDAGLKTLQVFCSHAKRSLPGDDRLCLNTERRKAMKEDADFHIAEAEGKPLTDRITELEQSIEQHQRLLEALRAQAKKEITKDAFRELKAANGHR
jgi:hypothetical protein